MKHLTWSETSVIAWALGCAASALTLSVQTTTGGLVEFYLPVNTWYAATFVGAILLRRPLRQLAEDTGWIPRLRRLVQLPFLIGLLVWPWSATIRASGLIFPELPLVFHMLAVLLGLSGLLIWLRDPSSARPPLWSLAAVSVAAATGLFLLHPDLGGRTITGLTLVALAWAGLAISAGWLTRQQGNHRSR
jgi:hypothetical protein